MHHFQWGNKELYRSVLHCPSKNMLQFKGQHSTSNQGKAGDRQAARLLLAWIYISRPTESMKSSIMKKEMKSKEIGPQSTRT